jgi:aryl-alcohol dehydrogenase-like predicted oxidoreductase
MTLGDTIRDHRTASAIIAEAVGRGVTYFDTADSYAGGESERVLGDCLSDHPRDRIVLSSKVFFPLSADPADRGLSRRHIFRSIEGSLRSLRTDYLDIYFCHRPDPSTPIAETIEAMNTLVTQGKIRHWGTSEWSPTRIGRAWQVSRRAGLRGPSVEQPQYSLVNRVRFESFIVPALARHGMGAVTWSPLASGLLSGKYLHAIQPGTRLDRFEWLRRELLSARNLERVRQFAAIAAEVGCSPAQLAIAYVASHPLVSSVLLGATSIEQLRENLAGHTTSMTPDLRTRVERVFPRRVKDFARNLAEGFERIS